MSDDIPDVYRPRTSRWVSWQTEAPHGEERTLTFRVKAGVEYEVVPDEEADDRLGTAAISNVHHLIRESCYIKATS